MRTKLLLAAALEKIHAIRNGKRDMDLVRLVLLENLVQKLTAVLQNDENGDDAEEAANGDGACACVAVEGPSERGRRTGEKHKPEPLEATDGPSKLARSCDQLSQQQENVLQFIRALGLQPASKNALEEELGPEPDIQFLDD
ncbi:uncharacterized protein LOC119443806 [Dermacentor silvarum]|uniref:uncharacterized protein LOC119443806 n=1 Tax=Dermacentor silvarum TaxID=543639 RepID=UPI001897BA0A|nr:uncharacterized protein LOC119443806 [Dermacentor silvarum]